MTGILFYCSYFNSSYIITACISLVGLRLVYFMTFDSVVTDFTTVESLSDNEMGIVIFEITDIDRYCCYLSVYA
jgi:hypothetical protein